MSKKFRKVLAAVLAATMVLGSGVVANAAEGSGSGTGSLDEVKHPDVFNVILPTDAGTQFNYILDPSGVIEDTDFEKYGGTASASFVGTGNMWFENKKASGSNIRPFTNESDPVTAYNRSNIDVDIKVTAKLATPSNIIIATSSVANDTTATPSMYLAMKATENNAPKEYPIIVAGATATASIASASNLAYETRYVNGEYVNKLTATASELKEGDNLFDTYFKKYAFVLTGDCNKGDWRGVTEAPPTVSLVWTIDKPDTAVEGNGPSVTLTTAGVITMSGLTADKNYAHSAVLAYGTMSDELDADPNMEWDVDSWNATTGGTLSFKLNEAWLNALQGKTATVTVTLTDGSTITCTQQF